MDTESSSDYERSLSPRSLPPEAVQCAENAMRFGVDIGLWPQNATDRMVENWAKRGSTAEQSSAGPKTLDISRPSKSPDMARNMTCSVKHSPNILISNKKLSRLF